MVVGEGQFLGQRSRGAPSHPRRQSLWYLIPWSLGAIFIVCTSSALLFVSFVYDLLLFAAVATNIIPPEASLPDKSTPSFGRLYQGFVEPALPVSLVATTTDFKAASSGEGWVAWLLTVLFSATAGAAATALGTHLYGKRVLRSRYRAL